MPEPRYTSVCSVLLFFVLLPVVWSWISRLDQRSVRGFRRNQALQLSDIRSNNKAAIQPGLGGSWSGDPNARMHQVVILSGDGTERFILKVPEDRYIYSYFCEQGIDLPIINKAKMCCQGCCTTCAVKVESGKVRMDSPLGLLKEMRDRGYALACSAFPTTDVVLRLQDEDEVYKKQWGDSFESGGVQWGGFVPDDD